MHLNTADSRDIKKEGWTKIARVLQSMQWWSVCPGHSGWLLSCSLYMPCLRAHVSSTPYAQECACPLPQRCSTPGNLILSVPCLKVCDDLLTYKRLHLNSWVYKALYNPILMEKIKLTCCYWHMFSNHSWQCSPFLQSEGLFVFLLFMSLLLPKFPSPSTTSLLNSYRLLIFPKLLWAEFVDPSSGSPEHFF